MRILFATSFLILVFLISISYGSNGFSLPIVNDFNNNDIFTLVRLPRTIGALVLGGILSVSGMSCQSVFQNTLVSPDLLGTSAGAVLGVVLGLILGVNPWFIPVLSFLSGITATSIVIIISNFMVRRGRFSVLILILTGIIISSLLSSLLSFLRYFLPDYGSIFGTSYYFMGSLNGIGWHEIILLLLFGFIPIILLFILSRWLDVLILPYDVLISQGVNVKTIAFLIMVFAAISSSAAVSVSGVIGWVSLIIPGVLRYIYTVNHRALLPLVFLWGASFMVVCDFLARILTDVEIPAGIVTSIIGAPVFLLLLFKSMKKSYV